MNTNLSEIGVQRVKSVASGEVVELKKFWQDQNVAIIFFRRWGCMLCRLWAKELADIAPVLTKHNIKLVGVGIEEAGSKEFVDGNYFTGDLYYVENISTYDVLKFKRFNVFSILASLLWKQSREAIFKGRSMGLEFDLTGDSLQNGGALLVKSGGKLLKHFKQLTLADRLPNLDVLQAFGLENEYNPETMANQNPEDKVCTLGVAN